MDNIQRFTNLMEGIKFRGIPDWNSENPLMDLGNHNCSEWEKLSEERQERGINLIRAILADIFQPLALKQFGHTGDSAIRGVLYNKMFPPDDDEELNSLGQQVRKEAIGIGLSEEQAEILRQWFVSCFPTWFLACIAEEINKWQLLPRVNAQGITDTLVSMFMEVEHADTCRHN